MTASFSNVLLFSAIHLVSIYILFFAHEITYNFFSIFIIFLYFFLFSTINVFLIFKIVKNKNDFKAKEILLKMFKSDVVYFISLAIFSIIIMFTYNHFTDTGYYFDLSSKFKEMNYIPKYNDQYRYASSYYVYSSFSKIIDYTIPSFYNFFTPFIFFLVLGSYINDWLGKLHRKNKFQFLIKVIFFIGFTLFLVFLNPYVISGNLIIQSSIILLVILCIFNKKYNEIPYVLLFCQFFSITGLLLSIIMTFSLIIFYLFFKNIKFLINKLPHLMICSSFYGISFPIFIKSINFKISLILFIIALFSTVIIFLMSLIFNYKITKKSLNNKFVNFAINQNILYSKITFYVLITLSIICSILVIIYFSTSYDQFNDFYEWFMLIISTILLLPILIYFIWTKKNHNYNENNNYWYLLIINLFIVTAIVLLMWISGYQQSSIWRITSTSFFINFDGCNPLLAIFMIYMFVYNILQTEKVNEWISSKNITSILTKKWKIFGSIGCAINAIIFSLILIIINVVPTPIRLESSLFNSNIQKNINLFTKQEVELLKKVINNNSFASDNMSCMYLNGTNETLKFINSIYGNDFDGRYWGYARCNFFDAQKDGHLNKNYINLPQFLINIKNALNNTNGIDFLILDKSTPYYYQTIEYIKGDSTKTITEATSFSIIKLM